MLGGRPRNGLLIASMCVIFVIAVALAVTSIARGRRSAQAEQAFQDASKSFASGDFEASEADIQRSLELEPSNPEAMALLGRTMESEGRLEEAEEAYASSLELEPSQPEIGCRLAAVHTALGEREQTVADLEAVLTIDDDYVPALLLLADAYRTSGRNESAAELYGRVLEIGPVGVDLERVEEQLGAVQ